MLLPIYLNFILPRLAFLSVCYSLVALIFTVKTKVEEEVVMEVLFLRIRSLYIDLTHFFTALTTILSFYSLVGASCVIIYLEHWVTMSCSSIPIKIIKHLTIRFTQIDTITDSNKFIKANKLSISQIGWKLLSDWLRVRKYNINTKMNNWDKNKWDHSRNNRNKVRSSTKRK